MSWRQVHVSISIEEAIQSKSYSGFQDDEGNPMSRTQAEKELKALYAKGHRYLQLAECPTFDPIKGCPGHDISEPTKNAELNPMF